MKNIHIQLISMMLGVGYMFIYVFFAKTDTILIQSSIWLSTAMIIGCIDRSNKKGG